MKYCPKCNSEYEDDVKFCKKDGTPLETKVEKAAEGKKCPKCGKTYIQDAMFCMLCGVNLVSANDKKICAGCGEELSEEAAFCVKCGTKVNSKSETPVKKEKSTQKTSSILNLIEVDSYKKFYISETPITNKQYKQVMGNLPNQSPYGDMPSASSYTSLTIVEAQSFCKKLSEYENLSEEDGYRLATSFELEEFDKSRRSWNSYKRCHGTWCAESAILGTYGQIKAVKPYQGDYISRNAINRKATFHVVRS